MPQNPENHPIAARPLNRSRRLMLQATGAAVAAPWAFAANAAGQIAGGKPITLVVSYAAGGGADLMARGIACELLPLTSALVFFVAATAEGAADDGPL